MPSLFYRWRKRSGPKEYENFDLRISKAGARYRAEVDAPGGGEAGADFDPPFTREELGDLLSNLGIVWRDARVARPDIQQTIRRIGTDLFRAVFQKKVAALWEERLRRAHGEGHGVRLRLRLKEPELADWPWEYLCDPDEDFFAISPETPIVRYPEMMAAGGVLRVRGPLRILIVTATPRRHGPLDTRREIAELQSALAELCKARRVELEVQEHASLSRLSERLQESFHVVHFIGHGIFDTARQCGFLLFEKENGAEERVSAETLGRVLKGRRIGLVVLNACEGGRGSLETPFAGLAQNLIKSRIPAVVAMQFPVPDPVAISFARHFYSALARWAPVDQAVSEARQALVAEHRIWEWGIPVLYLRSSNGGVLGPGLPIWRATLAVILVPVLLLALLWVVLFGREKEPKRAPPALEMASFISPHSEVSTQGCLVSDTLDMAFVRVNPGNFTMGSKPRDKDEISHEVTISKAFCMSEHEVTRGQWRMVMKEEPPGEGADDLPVTRVSWDSVRVFLDRLNAMEPGKDYRLSTEAEWEYAARAGSTQRFSFGDDPDSLSLHGNCKGENRFEGLAPVKSFQPNKWGLYDMHGNASEWVEDWYWEYPSGPVVDPRGPSIGEERVRRGGSFEIMADNCDAVTRKHSAPGSSLSDVGFRLVRKPLP
jgi:formylglycine-generating enzyme required for sulfatase activity